MSALAMARREIGAGEFAARSCESTPQTALLAVGSFAVLAIFLRQRGSPESTPVGAAHGTTSDTG